MISIRVGRRDAADVVALAAAVLLADQLDVLQLGQQRPPPVLGIEERAPGRCRSRPAAARTCR